MLSITQRQQNLKTYYNLYTGKIDGIEGNKTKESYKLFQKMNNLVVDGIYGEKTNNSLIQNIKMIQRKLNNKGYNLIIDGVVGTNTINAIKSFQKKNELVIDGVVGTKTMQQLDLTSHSWSEIKYFKKEEFTCTCGCMLNNININLVYVLDTIRSHFKNPIYITSGCRCAKHNKEVGGTSNSKHLHGKASDFYVKNVPLYEVINYCNKLKENGTIRYTYGETINMGNAVHIDID